MELRLKKNWQVIQMETVEVLVRIPKRDFEELQGNYVWWGKHGDYIKNGIPLPKYMEELKRKLLMEVDGGTDDRYLRYADVCDRISNTIDTYIKAESEEVQDGNS